ncbi:MAG: hypothetical protein ACTSUE_05005 [Promethearchaeota archaeon]
MEALKIINIVPATTRVATPAIVPKTGGVKVSCEGEFVGFWFCCGCAWFGVPPTVGFGVVGLDDNFELSENTLGDEVGLAEGFWVGVTEGLWVGVMEGLWVGVTTGLCEGVAEGFWLGELVSSSEVGWEEGCCVGPKEGLGVSHEEAETVASQPL